MTAAKMMAMKEGLDRLVNRCVEFAPRTGFSQIEVINRVEAVRRGLIQAMETPEISRLAAIEDFMQSKAMHELHELTLACEEYNRNGERC